MILWNTKSCHLALEVLLDKVLGSDADEADVPEFGFWAVMGDRASLYELGRLGFMPKIYRANVTRMLQDRPVTSHFISLNEILESFVQNKLRQSTKLTYYGVDNLQPLCGPRRDFFHQDP